MVSCAILQYSHFVCSSNHRDTLVYNIGQIFFLDQSPSQIQMLVIPDMLLSKFFQDS